MTARSLVDRFTAAVEAGDHGTLAELYTGDALFDAHVPNWRFQVQGSAAIVDLLEGWFTLPGRFHEVQSQLTTTGDVLVRSEWRVQEGSDDALVIRDMHLWRLAGDRIAEQVMYCAGRWDAPLVAQMAAEAPLIRHQTAPVPADDVSPAGEGRSIGAPADVATRAAIDRFDEAFGRRDVDGVMAAMAEDCVFEDTTPPDGIRHSGRTAVRRAWEKLFAGSPDARFEREDLLVAGDRAVLSWRYTWIQDGGGHVRGVDVFTVRDGKVAAKRSYVKG
ncbi:MAG TPA: nuclear transport factor 2 family protein [Euzebya sp.]|nr:nuclear transport factor 2 family protein [Euzebya sp.]